MNRFNLNRIFSWQSALASVAHENCFLLFSGSEKIYLGWQINKSIGIDNNLKSLSKINDFIKANEGDYIFSTLSYDLKNHFFKNISSQNQSFSDFPDVVFCTMNNLLIWENNQLIYQGNQNIDSVHTLFESQTNPSNNNYSSFALQAKVNKSDYLNNVQAIKHQIQMGNIYEMNYCIPFVAENVELNPVDTFKKLYEKTMPPHAAFVHLNNQFVLSASPERFIKKENHHLISQPIKGTIARGENEQADLFNKKALHNNPKERSENIMIVDLVRNDLSKIAQKNSVRVHELCGVYTFKTVHQLISTISCELKTNVDFVSILEATFPMGSMTGAPKLSAIKIAEEFEDFTRGIYSGSIGLILPNGDFDFNVVIRSILYSRDKQIVSCAVGGAITIESEPEKEYEECLLKLKALQESL